MRTAVILLMIQGCLGAFDTLWYHEYKLHLPHNPNAQRELRLHASRDFVYAVIFGSLAWLTWNGLWAWVLAGLLLAEIVITLWDFIEEDLTRKVPSGERIMHAIMGLVYGGFLGHLLPQIIVWSRLSTGFAKKNYGLISLLLTVMAAGVFVSGVRDLSATLARPNVKEAYR